MHDHDNINKCSNVQTQNRYQKQFFKQAQVQSQNASQQERDQPPQLHKSTRIQKPKLDTPKGSPEMASEKG